MHTKKKLNLTQRLIIPFIFVIIALVVVATLSIVQIINLSTLSNDSTKASNKVQIVLQRKYDHIK